MGLFLSFCVVGGYDRGIEEVYYWREVNYENLPLKGDKNKLK